MNVYVFHVASKCPEKYREAFPSPMECSPPVSGPGALLTKCLWPRPGEKTFLRRVGEAIGERVRHADP